LADGLASGTSRPDRKPASCAHGLKVVKYGEFVKFSKIRTSKAGRNGTEAEGFQRGKLQERDLEKLMQDNL
jgi:hypothetical protein